jgi:chromosome transmission fidelity protein 18
MAPVRYAVRHVLDQELQRSIALRDTQSRQARYRAGGAGNDTAPLVDKDKEMKAKLEEMSQTPAVKKDFFGRIVQAPEPDPFAEARPKKVVQHKVWVTYHEGLNNAVRKPLSLQEFMRGI